MLRIARVWLLEECGVEMPEGRIDGQWFVDHNLPIVVSCTCCGGTLILPNAFIDSDGEIYCPTCAGEQPAFLCRRVLRPENAKFYYTTPRPFLSRVFSKKYFFIFFPKSVDMVVGVWYNNLVSERETNSPLVVKTKKKFQKKLKKVLDKPTNI